MKILSNIPSVYKNMKSNKVDNKNLDRDINKGGKSAKVKDKITISSSPDQAKIREAEVSFVKQKLDSIPDIREARVQEIKQQIQEGNYNIDMEKVAEAIFNNLS